MTPNAILAMGAWEPVRTEQPVVYRHVVGLQWRGDVSLLDLPDDDVGDDDNNNNNYDDDACSLVKLKVNIFSPQIYHKIPWWIRMLLSLHYLVHKYIRISIFPTAFLIIS